MKRALPYFILFLAIIVSSTLCIIDVVPVVVSAQEPRVNIEPRNTPRQSSTGVAHRQADFRAAAELVLVPVVVTDRGGRLVTGLEKDHFRLFEDKIEQPITHFSSEDTPISVTVIFDCSGSMGAKLKNSRLAVSEFLKTANPEDEFSLILFDDTPHRLMDFTHDTGEIRTRLLQTESKGSTALLDAIYLGLNELKHAHNSRKALFVISDGGDNSSRYTTREIKNLVREADVQIYAIAIVETFGQPWRTAEEYAGPDLLDEIAHQSGGRMFEAPDTNGMPNIAAKIGMELRNQYVLGFAPAGARQDGKYHKLQVKLAQPRGMSALRASFRAGYFAPAR